MHVPQFNGQRKYKMLMLEFRNGVLIVVFRYLYSINGTHNSKGMLIKYTIINTLQ